MVTANWNSFARVNASQRWRKPSAQMGAEVTKAIVAEAQVASGMHVLDVASGTGEPAISIAALLNGTGRVVASDVSSGPLEIAAARARERALTNFETTVADVHKLPFPDGQFDRVTCRLGVMFFADCGRALAEIHRILKPGGRVSILAWGPREQPYFETTLGSVLRVCPELSFPQSGLKMFKFGEPGTLTRALRDAGFAHTEERFASIPWNWHDKPEELWAYFREVTIPFKPLFEAVPDSKQQAVDAAVMSEFHKLYDGEKVRFDANVVLASATK